MGGKLVLATGEGVVVVMLESDDGCSARVVTNGLDELFKIEDFVSEIITNLFACPATHTGYLRANKIALFAAAAEKKRADAQKSTTW